MEYERNRQPYDTVLDTIGWTPLIRLNRVTRGIRTPVYAKAEFFNPGGSVKDRIGLPIIERAEREGKLKPGGTIVEGTSGNTGVGFAGTGGTLTGVGRYLKERNKKVRVIAGDPTGSILAEYWRTKGKNKIEGTPYKVEGIGQDKLPGTLDMSVIDEYYTVSDKESFAMARRLTREEGLFVGGSSGLITSVALKIARELDDPNAMVVTLLCDTGERYLSKLYSDEWMRENQMLDTPKVALHSVLGRKNGVAPAVVSVAPGATVRQAIGLMSLHDVSQLPVMDGANCIGSAGDWEPSPKSLQCASLR